MSLSVSDVFEAIAGIAPKAAEFLPAPFDLVARIVGHTMTTAAALAELGLDPESEIVRMHSVRPEVALARAEIEAAVAAKFHQPPTAEDGSDVYPDE